MTKEKKISDAVDHLDQAINSVSLIKKFLVWKGLSMQDEIAPRQFSGDKVESIEIILNRLRDNLLLISEEYRELKALQHK